MEETQYTRQQVETVLAGIAEELKADKKRATMFLFGGATLMMTADLRGVRETVSDIDYKTGGDDDIVVAAVASARQKLPADVGSLPLQYYSPKRFDKFTKLWHRSRFFDRLSFPQGGGRLTIYVTKPELQIFTKLNRDPESHNSVLDKDTRDLFYLCRAVGITSADELYKLWEKHVQFSYGKQKPTLANYQRRMVVDKWSKIQAYTPSPA